MPRAEGPTDAGPGGASPRRRDAMRTSSSSAARKRKQVFSPILDPIRALPPSLDDSFVLDRARDHRLVGPVFRCSAHPAARRPRWRCGRAEDEEFGGSERTARWDFQEEDGGTRRRNGREGAVQARCESRGDGSKKCLATVVVLLGLLCGQWCGGGAEALAGSQKYSTRTVRTRYGTLRGVEDRSSTSVETYYGVPYATPPIGALRYMPPVTPTPWRGTKLADTVPPACPQRPPEPDSSLPRSKRAYLERLAPMLANQSEDCLYLNLYVPKTPHGELPKLIALRRCDSTNERSMERLSLSPFVRRFVILSTMLD